MKSSTMDFAFFSANLHHYVPSIPWTKHESLYSIFNGYHKPRNHNLYTADIIGANQLRTSGILVAFHLGQHELLPVYLAQMGLEFDILISRNVYARHDQSLRAHQDALGKAGKRFNFLFAEDRNIVFELRRSLRAERHVLIFADGNLGSENMRLNMDRVNFLAAQLQVRTGIAFLSHLLQVPVYPIIDQLKAQKLRIRFGTSIWVRNGESRTSYVQRCMQELFDRLAKRLDRHWTDWGCWNHMHRNGMLFLKNKNMPLNGEENEGTIRFDCAKHRFLLDRENYQLYRMHKA